ncbi:glycosyltransferase family 4 protein [Wenzhouxiangella sp. XN24]|uniref:glycosyltransferase family 4 protein n=1 Tax=Wenzhouxiangella sp. XN24 TaxID=2713569 RepID=UPI0013EABACE|nr:glycosyltransferase family 4 protein [Wenzhouxiangella sp. XN24]NGX17026.1 glycosyltransferase family 4 protein [Wenzhouxiangella sp. XN24]
MHILFISDNFPPEVNAPASRTFEHCREWVRAGCRVTVVTCAPNFPRGRVFEGYKNRLWQREDISGIQVVRVWTYITANEGFTRRILDYLSFMFSAVIASCFVRRVDVVVGTSPQFFAAFAAYVAAAMKRVPWVFELRDIWPESIRAVGAMKESRVLDWLEKVEMFLYRKAAAIVSVTHAFRDTLIRRGVDAGKIHVVTNGVDTDRFSPLPKDAALVEQLGLAGKFVGGYIGTHGMAHALDTLLDAAEIISKEPGGDRYRFLLLGDGANKKALMERATKEGLSNVVFVDSVPKDEVVRYWSALDVAIIHLKRTELFTTVIPSKLFECMGMAIPVLHGVAGESADIVAREEVGLAFEPENPAALCEGMRRLSRDQALYDRFRGNGPQAAKRYDRSVLAHEMLDIISGVVVR